MSGREREKSISCRRKWREERKMTERGNAWVRNGVSAWREERRGPWTMRHAVSRPKQTVFIQSRLGARVCDHLAIQICPTGFGKVLFMGVFFPSQIDWLSFVGTSHGCWIYFVGCFGFLLLHFVIINAKGILLKNPAHSQNDLKARYLYGHCSDRTS